MTLEPIRSRFAGDPEMREIVAFFVAEVPRRLEELRAAWASGDRARVRTIAHQIKGAAGGYGFPEIGESAAMLESAVARAEPSGGAPASAFAAFESFVLMLSRVTEAD